MPPSLLSELMEWRDLATQRASSLRQMQDVLGGLLDRIEADHPEWARLGAASGHFARQDARYHYLLSLRVIVQMAQLSYLFVRHHLATLEWWPDHKNDLSPYLVEPIKKFNIHILAFAVYAIASVTEEALRAIVRAAPSGTFKPAPTAGFGNIYPNVLKVLNLQELNPLFRIVSLLRNCNHTNGIFSPPDGKDVVIPDSGKDFEFKVGEPVRGQRSTSCCGYRSNSASPWTA